MAASSLNPGSGLPWYHAKLPLPLAKEGQFTLLYFLALSRIIVDSHGPLTYTTYVRLNGGITFGIALYPAGGRPCVVAHPGLLVRGFRRDLYHFTPPRTIILRLGSTFCDNLATTDPTKYI